VKHITESIVERGSGQALILIPGIQGRWEYLRPAVDALAAYFRVLTFSLDGGPRRRAVDRNTIDDEVEQIVSVLDARRIERAIVCGISYGGAVATRFAAVHPGRTAALVVASVPGPGWHLKPRHEMYARWWGIFGPLFLIETPFRLRPELAVTFPNRAGRLRFARWQLRTLITAPLSLAGMAARARTLHAHDIASDCRRVSVPTLVVTGEPALDRVVRVESTAAYAAHIPGARCVVLEATGHLGTITRPAAFAAAVHEFVDSAVNAFVARPFQGRDGGAESPALHQTEVA
jgi:pimeloyl-ACP methyl ester carboxylesterase